MVAALASAGPAPDRSRNLAGWLYEPTVQDAVIKMLLEAAYPLVLRDLVCTGGLPSASAQRVLGRLHGRGLVTRQKLWMHRPRYCHRRRASITDGAKRAVWAYEWIGAEGERSRDDEGDDDE